MNLNIFDDKYLEQNPKTLYMIASIQGIIVGLLAGFLMGIEI